MADRSLSVTLSLAWSTEEVQDSQGYTVNPSQTKPTKNIRHVVGDVTPLVECFPGMHDVVGSIPSSS